MDPHIDHKEFERFVRRNADQCRLYPSERVWEGIHDALHGRRRRYGLVLASLLLLLSVGALMMISPGKERTGMSGQMNGASLIANYQEAKRSIATEPGFLSGPSTVSRPIGSTRADRGRSTATDATAGQPSPDGSRATARDLPLHEGTPATTQEQPSETFIAEGSPTPASIAPLTATIDDIPAPATVNPSNLEPPATVMTGSDPAPKKQEAIAAPSQQSAVSPETAEKKLPAGRTASRLTWQVYATPTVSYRTLSENTAYTSAALYNSVMNGTGASFTIPDVNNMVYHRPDMGFQFGIQAATPLSPWLRFTGGLQLGISKYNIQAYKHTPELATIMLTDRSITTVTQYRNAEGPTKNWLRNFYFSASLPLGLELKLSDGNRNYFGVAGSLQPTYVIDNRSYLITADYKNYAEMPSLLRRWNLNTSFEIFAQQTTGKVQWRVGPQIRYQAFSSFSRNYPIREHLFDFGLKLGIQLR